ncbi:hypothetical protein IW967_02790 [Alicyclobacillus mali]|uniref:DUF4134 domain-containing protein n=1 Tax=Alicyclobacillus mali (ex Roth et al. 2021) TaxID=1123961 RepID=A0ABS0F0H9_9BACL|nr:TcpD family membrane protein [Alicyclobacillus mali (ex Roth et al. 2021)]MBF8376799.1 hypothetical protein [Alicyclobacillus mali (ex Roth et al. 2021)]
MNGTGTTLSDISSNPLWSLLDPIFSIMGVVLIAVIVYRLFRHYVKGDHSNMMVSVVFGMLALFFLLAPTVFFPIVQWLVGKIAG